MAKMLLGLLAVTGLGLAQATLAPVVDLGYAKYQGLYNSTYDQNIYRGIRYAAPPVGSLRWQMPQPPGGNRSTVIPAVDYPPQCPQSPPNSGSVDSRSNQLKPRRQHLTSETDPAALAVPSSEDCLFLNVVAPANRQKLPVLVYIHGGGYGVGNNRMEFTEPVRTSGNSYISVSIAYRLGAFGFLSSAEVSEAGIVNVAIHDMRFALQWVKENIHHFGGDPEQVTIAGVSSGGGGVMLLAMANGGTEGDSLFKSLIPASPYLPTQWNFDDAWPTESYQAFVDGAGCADAEVPFKCLLSVDTVVLQNVSAKVSASANYGQWAFIPVTDGSLIRKRPSEQLVVDKSVNGHRVLAGNVGNEGAIFTPQNITNKEDFIAFVLTNYPRLSEQNLTSILNLYAVPDDASGVYADSDGLTPPFSTTNSNWAVGWQQAANNLYAEATFVCPSYWMADAFAGVKNRSSWKYQLSVPPAEHGMDVLPLLSDPRSEENGMDEIFRTAFQQIWGNFIVKGDPTLSAAQVDTAASGNVTAASTRTWLQWGGRPGTDLLLNLNMTGGMPVVAPRQVDEKTIDLVTYVPSTNGSYPEFEAAFNLVPGSSWEDGRGRRCQLWVDLGQWALE